MKRRQSNSSNTGGKGAKRMREFGYTLVGVWLDASEREAIRTAADKAGMKVASWVRKVACEAAGIKYTFK